MIGCIFKMSAPIEAEKRGRSKKSTKTLIDDIKSQTKELFNNRKCANNLINLISYTQNENDEVVLACVRSLHRVFHHLITSSEMYVEKPVQTEDDLQDLTKEERYRVWLLERYTDASCQMLEMLTHRNNAVQELSLATLMKLIADEGKVPLKRVPGKESTFPAQSVQRVIEHLLSRVADTRPLITRFQEYLEYDDVRYFTMKAAVKVQRDTKNVTECFLNNLFTLLENLSMPTHPEDGKLSNFLSKVPDCESPLKEQLYKEQKKMFTSAWLLFLKNKLTASLYKKVLVIVHEKVMPFMTNPLQLSDFLTDSYNIGGSISLLALNGIFVLVHSYNLDYPDFYQKLYALLEPPVFHVKYRARFFFLLDLFLSSTHLPSYLVAAFAKKLSRLALTAPPGGLTVILPFVYNLVRRHPSCQVLLHKPDGPQDISGDPYLIAESDPAKSKALESSLWELKTLQDHYHHSISTEAKKMDLALPPNETDLSDLLEVTTSDLFEREIKKKAKTIPTTYEPPKGLFSHKDDTFRDLWLLE